MSAVPTTPGSTALPTVLPKLELQTRATLMIVKALAWKQDLICTVIKKPHVGMSKLFQINLNGKPEFYSNN